MYRRANCQTRPPCSRVVTVATISRRRKLRIAGRNFVIVLVSERRSRLLIMRELGCVGVCALDERDRGEYRGFEGVFLMQLTNDG